jgi:small subunit ribosomal protein S1
MSESFAELFEESFASQQIKPGSIITGIVVAVNDDVVIVSAGLKSEAVIPIEQFKNDIREGEISVGDEIEVALDAVEDGFGETRLSREKAIRARTWTELEKAFEKGEVVEGVINGRVKGGFTVEIDNVRAFLPGSLVDVRPVRDPAYLEGKSLEFKVIKLDQRRNNVVVSRRAVVEQEYSEEREQLLAELQEGNTVKGIVKNLTDYGAFVDLGGIDGLLHITDMAWKRVKHPSEVVNVGDEIDVKILKFDRERQRVSLGMKQLGDDPWKDLARRYPPSKASYTYPKWIGRTRMSILRASCRLARKWKSWSSKSTKSGAGFRSVSSSVNLIRGLNSLRHLTAVTRWPARSSRSLTSESLSVLMAA